MKRKATCTLSLTTLAAIAALLSIEIGSAVGEDAPAKVTYDEHVRPILREHCFSCHGPDTKKADLSLDNYAAAMRGGSTGEIIAPGDPDSSRLWALVNHTDEPKMPPKQDKLPEAKLATIKAWLVGGALENSGSVAKAAKKPALAMSAPSGGKQPSGPAAMPEGLWRQPIVASARPAAVTAIAASPWAPLVAIAGQKQIALYHTESGKLLGMLPFAEGIPYVLKFSRNGSLLLAGGGMGARNGRVVVYDVKSGNRVFEVGDELDVVLAADISDNSAHIALGGPSRVVRVFSTADGSLEYEIRKHTEWIYALEFSPDGVLLATADRGGGMFVWEADTGREYQNLAGHKGGISDVSWRLDSNVLASASEDGAIKQWEMENGAEIKSFAAHPGGATSVEFLRDGRIASIGRDKIAKLWDAAGAQQKAFEAFADIGLELAVSHDGTRMIAGDWTGEVRLLDVAAGKPVATLPPNPPTLEALIQAETAKVAAATAAAQSMATELAAADASAKQAAAAAQAASDAAAAAQAAVTKLAADKQAAEAALPAKAEAAKQAAEKTAISKAALDKAPGDQAAQAALAAAQAAETAANGEKAALEKSIAEITAATPPATTKLTAAQAEAAKQLAAKQAADQALSAKAAAHKVAADAQAATQAALASAVAEKAAYDQAHPAAPATVDKSTAGK